MRRGLLMIEEDQVSEPVEFELTDAAAGKRRCSPAFLAAACAASEANKRLAILPEAGRILAVRVEGAGSEDGAAVFTVLDA